MFLPILVCAFFYTCCLTRADWITKDAAVRTKRRLTPLAPARFPQAAIGELANGHERVAGAITQDDNATPANAKSHMALAQPIKKDGASDFSVSVAMIKADRSPMPLHAPAPSANDSQHTPPDRRSDPMGGSTQHPTGEHDTLLSSGAAPVVGYLCLSSSQDQSMEKSASSDSFRTVALWTRARSHFPRSPTVFRLRSNADHSPEGP